MPNKEKLHRTEKKHIGHKYLYATGHNGLEHPSVTQWRLAGAHQNLSKQTQICIVGR